MAECFTFTRCLWPPIKSHIDYWWCFDNNIQVLRDGVRDLDRETFHVNQRIEESRVRTEIIKPGVLEWSKVGTEKLLEARRILQYENIPKSWNLISRYSMGKRAKKAAEEIAKHQNDGNFNAMADPDPAPPPAKDVPEFLTLLYEPLKLSYDYLANDSERDLFLLCCLFPEDYDISIELLTLYSIGLRLFDGNSSIEEARNRTQRLVENIKRRALLIDGTNKLHVRMHDAVRDVAIYIGSTERNGFLKSLNMTSIESSSDAECHWMSVDISNERMEIPEASRFPKLRLLMLLKLSSDEFSNISFQGMKDLNVLSFPSTWIGSLPPTLGLLKDLRALCLFESEVENISVIGELSSLEIFICNGCKNITELPAEFGRLNRLRLMELNGCSNLQRIPFGILSSLVRLEELKMLRSFDGWEAEENGKEMRNASLTELESLCNLTCLEIEISYSNLAAQEIRLPPKLVKYRIHIGFKDDWHEETDYEKVMKLNLPSDIGAVGKWIQILVNNTELLYLEGDGSNIIDLEECQDLRNLDFRNCSRVKKLVKTKDSKFGIVFPMLETMRLEELGNLEEICDGTIILNQNVSFHNLKSMVITECSNLRYLFSGSVATICLLGLEVLEILRCEAMEQLFRNDTYGGIELPKLKQLRLGNLPILKAFCQGLENIKFPNLTEIWIGEETSHEDRAPLHFLCNPKELKIRGSFSEWETGGERRNAAVRELESLPSLTCLEIEIPDWNLAPQEIRLSPKLVKYCIRVTSDNYLIEPRDYDKVIILNFLNDIVAVGKWIQILVKNTESLILEGDGSNNFNIAECDNLRDLKFSNCSRVKKLMKTKDCKLGIVFPLLETLSLWGLKNLEEICDDRITLNQSVSFRNLKSIVITECSNLTYLFSVSVATTCLLQLEVLEILRCEGMEQVFRNEITDNDTNVPIEFPKLKKLELFNLPNLIAFCQGVHSINFPQLTEMVIGNLTILTVFCQGIENIKFPNLTEMWIGELPKRNNVGPLDSETPHDDRTPLHFLCNPKELKIHGSFSELETGGERRNAAVRELESLPNLTCLEIEIPDWNLAPQEIRLSPIHGKVIILNLPSDIVAVIKWIQILVKNTESLTLEGDVSNNFNVAECDNLRNLEFRKCSRVKKLVKTKDCKSGIVFPLLETLKLDSVENLEEICDGTIILNKYYSLRNLKSIVITECSNLRYLLSVSVARRCLLQLEVLEILRCEGMKQVFRNETTDNNTDVHIEFPKLKKLELFNLPNLTAFCQGVQNIKFPQLTEMVIGNLPKLDTVCSFNLRTLFSLSMARANLFQLQVLDIQWCEAMEQVLMNEIKDVRIEFPNLKKLKLSHLPMIPNHQES